MWKKQCPKCGKDQTYSNKCNFDAAIKNNTTCLSCIPGHTHSEKTKSKLSKMKKDIPLLKKRLRPYEATYNRFVNKSRVRKLECLISYEQFLEFTKIDRCHYCNEHITWSEYDRQNKIRSRYNLDRKNTSIGYSVDNCVVCCKQCNYVKGKRYSYEIMIKIGKVLKEERELKQATQVISVSLPEMMQQE